MMSYDVSLMIDTGGPEQVEVTWRNMTSNVACMWRHAGADLAEFDGRKAGAPERDSERQPMSYLVTYRSGDGAWADLQAALQDIRQIREQKEPA